MNTVNSLVQRAKAASAKVDTAKEMEGLDYESSKDVAGLMSMTAADLDEDTQREIADIKAAQTDVQTDPYTRYLYVQKHIKQLLLDKSINPDSAHAAFLMATAPKLPGSKADARPVLLRFNTADDARNYARENCGAALPPIVVASVWRKPDNKKTQKINQNGWRFYAPHSMADVEAYGQLKELRNRGAEALVTVLNGERMFDISEAIWMALWLFDGSRIADQKTLRDEFLPDQTGMYRDKAKENRHYWRFYRHSADEVLLVPNKVTGDRNFAKELVDRLRDLQGYNEQFNAGTLDVDYLIAHKLKRTYAPLLSREDFLSGKYGQIAITGKADGWVGGSKVTGDALILFERLLDGRWRTALFNRAACAVIQDGNNQNALRYHWWTNPRAMPESLVSFITKGTPVEVEETTS